MTITPSTIAIGAICAGATAGVIASRFRLPEAVWAVTGAVLLLCFGLMTPTVALRVVAEAGMSIFS